MNLSWLEELMKAVDWVLEDIQEKENSHWLPPPLDFDCLKGLIGCFGWSKFDWTQLQTGPRWSRLIQHNAFGFLSRIFDL